jgi:hypothetical protein
MTFPGEKLIIKLWETLADKGMGSLLQPWHIIRTGKARNEVRRAELLMLAQTEADIAEIQMGRKYVGNKGVLCPSPSNGQSIELAVHVDERIEPKMDLNSLLTSRRQESTHQARKEINVSKAIIHAEDILANDAQIPPEREIEEDWLFAWQEYAGRVSTEDLQQLWGKILAGEIKSPGSHSIRTLDCLKGISKTEAELISKLAEFVIADCTFSRLDAFLEKNGLRFGELLFLQEIGILVAYTPTMMERYFLSVIPDRFLHPLFSNGKVLVVMHDDATKELHIPAHLLTVVGKQILGMGSFKPNVEYLRLAGKEIIKQGFKVELADYCHETETTWRYFNAEALD